MISVRTTATPLCFNRDVCLKTDVLARARESICACSLSDAINTSKIILFYENRMTFIQQLRSILKREVGIILQGYSSQFTATQPACKYGKVEEVGEDVRFISTAFMMTLSTQQLNRCKPTSSPCVPPPLFLVGCSSFCDAFSVTILYTVDNKSDK